MFGRTMAALLVAAPLLAQAQAHPLVGAWDIEYAGAMHIENGMPTPVMMKGTMTVVAQGDSLVATVKTTPPAGMPPRADMRLATISASGPVTFIYRSQARVNINGEESVRESITTWSLTVSGDQLSGTMARQVGGGELPGGDPQPVKGTRAKSE